MGVERGGEDAADGAVGDGSVKMFDMERRLAWTASATSPRSATRAGERTVDTVGEGPAFVMWRNGAVVGGEVAEARGVGCGPGVGERGRGVGRRPGVVGRALSSAARAADATWRSASASRLVAASLSMLAALASSMAATEAEAACSSAWSAMLSWRRSSTSARVAS